MNILITGANRGIGLALTKQFLQKRATVYATCRDTKKAIDLLSLKNEFPKTLTVLNLDVSSPGTLRALDKDLKSLTSLDLLINNAGVIGETQKSFELVNPDDISSTLETNTLGPVRVTQAFLSRLKSSSNPMVVHITSLMGSIQDNGSGGYYGYRMSKAALNMFHKSFSVDYPSIISLVIHPGWVKTDMGGSNAPTLVDESAAGIITVIEKAKPSDNGSFFDFTGKKLPW